MDAGSQYKLIGKHARHSDIDVDLYVYKSIFNKWMTETVKAKEPRGENAASCVCTPTSPAPEAKVRKPPDVPKADSVSDDCQQILGFFAPVSPNFHFAVHITARSWTLCEEKSNSCIFF